MGGMVYALKYVIESEIRKMNTDADLGNDYMLGYWACREELLRPSAIHTSPDFEDGWEKAAEELSSVYRKLAE